MDAHHGPVERRVLIREYEGERDLAAVEKLERSCEIGSRRGFSILTNMMGDPMCRVRLYPLHIMLVAELVGDGAIVGVVRGCMKGVGTGHEEGHVRIGCILGLRVSPKHRRLGIGSKLIQSVETWAIRNGAQYTFLATEENNMASINLFISKFRYLKLSSLSILIETVDTRTKKRLPHNINIEKLSVQQAIFLYKDRLGGKKLFPADIDAILGEQLSLGTWVSYFKREDGDDFTNRTPNSWAMLSMWNTYQSYKLQLRGAPLVRCFHATINHIGSKVLPCLKASSSCELLSRPFGFIFLFGLYGEGESMGDLMRSLWCFASNLAGRTRDCKAVVTELGGGDPLRQHVIWGSPAASCINDLWFFKRVDGGDDDGNGLARSKPMPHVFVDPRDF